MDEHVFSLLGKQGRGKCVTLYNNSKKKKDKHKVVMCGKKINSGVTERNEGEIYVLFLNILFFQMKPNRCTLLLTIFVTAVQTQEFSTPAVVHFLSSRPGRIIKERKLLSISTFIRII